MNDEPTNDAVLRVLRLMADQLERYLEGDETALETLGETLEESELSVDDLQTAVLVLRSLCASASAGSVGATDHAPGKHAQRVLSTEERAILAPEAWGYLLRLRSQGSLDAEQCERVLGLVAGSSERPVSVEQMREAAVQVAMTGGGDGARDNGNDGSFDLRH